MSRHNADLAEFLRVMRARVRPEDVGLPVAGHRRTPGLRRQEVAQSAAISVEWYTRLEQGRVGSPGTTVLDALAQALRLSESERHHLHLIARGEAPPSRHRPAPVGAALQELLCGMPLLPAYVVDFRFDVLARNEPAAALFGADFGSGDTGNVARMLFLVPRIREMQLDWTRIARETVGNLRANLARHRTDARLRALIDELRHRSEDFSAWWNDQTVQERANGTKRIRHPVGGELTICYTTLATLDDSAQYLIAVTPADAAAEQALRRIVASHAGALTGTARAVG
ncbi:helix-turn-helix transcriptional regulator [Actinoallomurus rhizosphaericola]|uniref:helix-turn-helix transcriptional regulator n=1 Tax=Actinoallomurus rhizosphaericola TaxID=2952536 RepID=UPI0020905ABF|nr:helix-turn-helix transcriptional regulator [Actinoallomurus rhizosphaericola]MCO5994026.1 helix-turn-helix transcriptional regulator [Actinoallomurus rhizosphaericola]